MPLFGNYLKIPPFSTFFKRIVSAETICGNTVCISRDTIFQAMISHKKHVPSWFKVECLWTILTEFCHFPAMDIASRDAPLSDRLSSIKNTPHHGSETVKSDLTINASPVLCACSYLFKLSLENSECS